MVEVDFDKLADVSSELINYDGKLPLLIRTIIWSDWVKYLEDNNIYDEIILDCIKSKPHTMSDAIKELEVWVKNNPEYKSILR